MKAAWIGWVATAVFATSYFVPSVSMLKKIQAAAACLWILYGVNIGAIPVIVANVIVAGAALFSTFRAWSGSARQESERAGSSGRP